MEQFLLATGYLFATSLLSILDLLFNSLFKQFDGNSSFPFFLSSTVPLVLCGLDLLMHASTTMSGCNRFLFDNMFQIQHPRSHLNRFDMVITPRHDYYPLTPHAQEQIPWFLRRWITPREPPGKNVVGIEYLLKWLICDDR